MTFSDVPVPGVYKESADFRFFLKWIEMCLSEIQNKTENIIDLLDPLRCPSDLLWMLADTCGYKYDERASAAFNRLVIKYFPHIIRNRGSLTGVSLAAEINLAQFNLRKYAEENPVLEDRLEDTSLPANAVRVTPHPDAGFIDIVYYSENDPTDICIEYARPIGVYCFSSAGVDINIRTKISVDARLTNLNDGNVRPGPMFVAKYRRADYASLQKFFNPEGDAPTQDSRFSFEKFGPEKRNNVYYRNSDYEGRPLSGYVDPGYRSLFSLQLSNNEHIVKALLPSLEEPEKVFSVGFDPQDVSVHYPNNYVRNSNKPLYNLRVDRELEESFTPSVYTIDSAQSVTKPRPAVNTLMSSLGDAISLNDGNTKYTKRDPVTGEITVEDT